MDRAISELEQGYKINPQSTPILPSLINLYIQQKKYDIAIVTLDERIRKDLKDAFSYNLLGKVYGAKKDYKQAEKAFQRAVDIQPMWPEPNNNLARLYLSQGKQKEAVEKFEAALKNNPASPDAFYGENPTAYLSLGFIYQQNREDEKAIQIYERALERNPNLWVAANNLAALLSGKSGSAEDLERALTLAKRAYLFRSEEPAVLDTLGWIYYQKGDMNQALDLIEKALAGDPENPALNYHMGMVLYKTGRTDEAREKLAKATEGGEKFPGREEAEKVLRKLL
jgi:tetratricopeptide (TPR) repeat protein